MKLTASSIAIASLLSALSFTSTQVAAETSANVGVTTNYLWRGFEQTEGDPAVFAGLDWSSSEGWYAGVWASSISGADAEVDLYGGYTFSNGGVDYDLGYIVYLYPGLTEANNSEIYALASYNNFSVGAWLLAEADGADFADTLYLEAGYELPIDEDSGVSFHVGHYSGDAIDNDSIDLKVEYAYKGFNVGISKVQISDVDADDTEEVKLYAGFSHSFDL